MKRFARRSAQNFKLIFLSDFYFWTYFLKLTYGCIVPRNFGPFQKTKFTFGLSFGLSHVFFVFSKFLKSRALFCSYVTVYFSIIYPPRVYFGFKQFNCVCIISENSIRALLSLCIRLIITSTCIEKDSTFLLTPKCTGTRKVKFKLIYLKLTKIKCLV